MSKQNICWIQFPRHRFCHFLWQFYYLCCLEKNLNIHFHFLDINHVARTFSDNWILMGDPSWNGRKDVNIYSETGNSPWNLKYWISQNWEQMKWPVFALLAALFSEDLQGAGIGWMKVDSNGHATPAEHQVQISENVDLKVIKYITLTKNHENVWEYS